MKNIKYSIDLAGRTFGSLLVVDRIPANNEYSYDKWNCICSCGNKRIASADKLIKGVSTYCGPNHIDLVGKKFGKLTVVKRLENSRGNENKRWLCLCECGEYRTVITYRLLNGKFIDCGNHQGYENPQTSVINNKIKSYKDGAKKRGLIFDLTIDDFLEIIKKNCFYCDSPPQNMSVLCRGSLIYSGIDRKDNSLGYTVENCVPCCDFCNSAKLNKSLEEFIEWGIRLGEGLETLITKGLLKE